MELGGTDGFYLFLFLLCVKGFKVAFLNVSNQRLFFQGACLWIELWWKMFRKGKKRHSSSSSQSSEISTKSKVGVMAWRPQSLSGENFVSSNRCCVKGTNHGRPADVLQTRGFSHSFFCTRDTLCA